MATTKTKKHAKTGLYIKLAREILKTAPTATIPALTEALKWKCAQLHIGYDTDIILVALKAIGLGAPEPQDGAGIDTAPPAANLDPPTPREAAAILARLGISCRSMP